MPIAHLQDQFLTLYSCRQEASTALKALLNREESRDAVIALSPSGRMDNYWRVMKRANGRIVVLTDDAENIVQRITFYDKDSNEASPAASYGGIKRKWTLNSQR